MERSPYIRQIGVRDAIKLPVIFFLITAPKVIPALISLRDRHPRFERTVMSFKLLMDSLFNPWQEFRMVATRGTPFHFHEFGCYLAWSGIFLVAVLAFNSVWRKKYWRILVLFFFWLWVGCGWGTPINPWLVFQNVPVLNHAHIQSRLFVIMFLFFTILVAMSLDHIGRKRLWWIIAVLVLAESSYVRLHITSILGMDYHGESLSMSDFILSNNLDATVESGRTTAHYLHLNTSALNCNDHADFPSEVKSIHDSNYLGEIFYEHGAGSVKLEQYLPGEIQFHHRSTEASTIVVNTNYLWGWRTESPGALVTPQTFGDILRVEVPRGEGKIRLTYWPSYLLPCLGLFMIGILLYLFELKRLMDNRNSG